MAMSPSTINVITYLQNHNGENLTAADVAEALGLEKRTVDGAFTSGVQRKQMGARVKAEVEVADEAGNLTHKNVKFLKLNDAGLAFKPVEADAE